jgi:hypothetical protein
VEDEEEEEEGGGAARDQDISMKIRTYEQALHCISEVMHFAIDSNSSSLLEHKKVETSFFVGSVEEISMDCILETCDVQCNRALICTVL